ncbi:hypothetical protein [Terrisporobacter glycolicus]|uniref:Uncharacterized protein n=1 Tax=Terrisporobacter glycolicus ATCC 14880 = DSM 1288 TaxID=1121315 RepID=A0ABZ2EUK7_9FIRM|nr:hypothetical protein [Terrisporobacter glycolicus]
MSEELFWPILIILGCLYLSFVQVKEYKAKRNLKSKIKLIVTIATMPLILTACGMK